MLPPEPPIALRKPLLSILITIVLVFVGQLIGTLVGSLIAYPFFNGTPTEFVTAMRNAVAFPEFKTPLLIIQGAASVFGLIIFPAFLLNRQQRSIIELVGNKFYIQPALLVPMIVIVFMGVNSFFIEWNQNLQFPDFLSGFERWARASEDKLGEITKYMTSYDTIGQFLLAFVVIAILPGIGEELVFRGMIQNDLFRATRNIHVAIWISAIIFSAIHFQFFGFTPRLFLGALFGYIYYWSGSLLMAMLAHFINNAFTIIALYLYQRGSIDIDLENPEAAPWQAVLFSGIFTILLLYAFKIFYAKRGVTPIPD